MKPVFTSDEMRSCDKAATENYRVPGIVLMENAARGAADIVDAHFGPLHDLHALIFCGRGNNGGDGFAIARHLLNRGMSVHVVLTGSEDELTGDAATNFRILEKTIEDTGFLIISRINSPQHLDAEWFDAADIVIDALLGTGLSNELKGTIGSCAEMINAWFGPVVAVDIPTGINSYNGEVLGVAVHATATVTMGGLKRGLLFGAGREHAGDISVVDIGMPKQGFYQQATQTFRVEEVDVLEWLPSRRYDVHKYEVGSIFALAGSVGLTGAAAMACEAALRCGAGIVRLGVPESLNMVLEMKLTEVMTKPLKQTAEGTLSLDCFETAISMVDSSTICILGPGISRHDETMNLVRKVITESETPIIVDADGLFALTGNPDLLTNIRTDVVLTPHIGEFSRMTGKSSEEIRADAVDIARRFSLDYGVTLVLKGSPTITATPNGIVYINSSGNAGMATAGSGDVLTGIIAGLAAQDVPLPEAAWCSVFLHGLAGDYARNEFGEHGLIATDILKSLPRIMNRLGKGETNAS